MSQMSVVARKNPEVIRSFSNSRHTTTLWLSRGWGPALNDMRLESWKDNIDLHDQSTQRMASSHYTFCDASSASQARRHGTGYHSCALACCMAVMDAGVVGGVHSGSPDFGCYISIHWIWSFSLCSLVIINPV